MEFKVGDKVEAIDDNFEGVVVAVKNQMILVETEDGFEYTYKPSEIILIKNADILDQNTISYSQIEEVKKEKEEPKRRGSPLFKTKDKEKAKFIVDLHSHEISDTTRGMTAYDILNLQLATAKHKIEFAIKKRINKIVLIHGVGEGVLKQEIHTLLRRYNNIEFYDADFKTYGIGATEVRIFQNLDP